MEITGLNILLVDGNKNLLKSNADLLQTHGFTAFMAASLTEARRTMLTHQIDAIVTEAVLADGSGFDFCREMRAKSGIPILFLTALRGKDDEIKGFEAGGLHYIAKPYNAGELMARLHSALSVAR